MVKRVCLVSGGTGGHLLPAAVLADALTRQGHDALLVTEGRAVEESMLGCAPCRTERLPAAGRRRGLPMGMISMIGAVRDARRLLREREVDVVLGTGGRMSLAVGLAARSARIPVCLLEQNATTGRANRMLLPFARRIYLGLPQSRRVPRSLFTGTPLRPELGGIDRVAARRRLGLPTGVPVVLVTGGSQGADVLNRLVPEALARVPGPLQVVHLAGTGREQRVRDLYDGACDLQARVHGIVLEMADLYGAADLVICRGGGGTVAELMAVGRPAVVIPYPHHRDRQQLRNGQVLAEAGAALVVEQAGLAAAGLAARVAGLLADPEELQAMGRRARGLSPRSPCARIIEDLKRLEALD